MSDPLDQLKQWREIHHAAQSPHADEFAVAMISRFHREADVMVPALLTAVQNVLNDHEPEPYAQGADYCRECCHRWPCATYAAIRDALGGDDRG